MGNVPSRMEDVDLRYLPPVSFFRAYHVFLCSTPCLEFASVSLREMSGLGPYWFPNRPERKTVSQVRCRLECNSSVEEQPVCMAQIAVPRLHRLVEQP